MKTVGAAAAATAAAAAGAMAKGVHDAEAWISFGMWWGRNCTHHTRMENQSGS